MFYRDAKGTGHSLADKAWRVHGSAQRNTGAGNIEQMMLDV
jgi:hypothetical protein